MKVFLYADGGSRGNPGIAGSGAVLIDAASKAEIASLVYAFAEKTTNNVAEYRGLLEGLKAARELGATEVYVFLDSKLVVEQMTGRWKIKHPDMKTLAVEAKDVAAGFERVTYEWVPRAQNKRADELSNVAMDASAAGAPTGLVTEKSVLPAGEAAPAGAKSAPQAEPQAAHHGPTRLILLRHGETPMTAKGLYAGRKDVSLNERGHKQAATACDAILGDYEIDAVYSSPLKRCQETALGLGMDVTVHQGLVECDFGDFDGLRPSEAADRFPLEHARWRRDPRQAPPGGESCEAVARRAVAAVEEIVAKHPGETVVIVSHVYPIKSIVAHALGGGLEMLSRMFVDVCSRHLVETDGSSLRLRGFNDITYLQDRGLETIRR